MKQTIIVRGSNFIAKVKDIDIELLNGQDVFVEAATRALETVFGNKNNTNKDVEITIPNPDDEPNLGFIVECYRIEDEKDTEKYMYVKSRCIAENAGLFWIADQLKQIEDNLQKKLEL